MTASLLTAIALSSLAQSLDLSSRTKPEPGQEPVGAPAAEGETQPGEPTADLPQTTPARDEPILQVIFEDTEAVPGQPLSLRLTVLVPTFLPQPPVWPSLEAPNLLVRLPEGSTRPTSERIDRETWSGVTRHYRISPMVPGDFEIPPQEVIVTYADPRSSQPVKVSLTTEALAFSGVVPEEAKGLDPFIAARGLELSQLIDGNPEAMVPGDSVARTVTARIQGTSPMFLPELMPATTVEGIAAYADDPVLEERDDRGSLAGTRTERVTLVAQGGGSGQAPPVSFDWYNLERSRVETAAVEGVAIAVEGPPARSAEPRNWRVIALSVLAGALVLIVGLQLLRRLLPPLRRWIRARYAEWLASETHAYARLRRVAVSHDHAALRPALDAWAAKIPTTDPRQDSRLQAALAKLGEARYGRDAPVGFEEGWRALIAILPEVRRASRTSHPGTTALPPLNPGA